MSASQSTPVYPQPAAAQSASQMLETEKGDDLLERPVLCKVPYAARYERVAGEPEYHFFKRERNSLSVYMEPVDIESDEDQVDFDDKWDLLEKKAALTFAEVDDEYRAGVNGAEIRHIKPTYMRQRAKRQQVRADRARKLMFALKYLLALKKGGA